MALPKNKYLNHKIRYTKSMVYRFGQESNNKKCTYHLKPELLVREDENSRL